MADRDDITQLLREWQDGSEVAEQELVRALYPRLRAMASRRLAGAKGATLDTQDLVHEAYLKLVRQESPWHSRAHFLAISARLMRRIVIDRIRRRSRSKRGGDLVRATFSEDIAGVADAELDWFELDDALSELREIDSRAERVVELKFFSGMTLKEIAQVLEVGTATVERSWRFARAWLADRLRRGRSEAEP